ncbi:hypothetical protein GALMADRAFT_777902 [Galerina marginata CBS 339.88]|uniref:DUF6533 domain-containing protein n=1 Tax=Galerina marginata (strain CBS 339.88) TaxID=685588 RepID=A0A067SLA5_GALM3|nr:hypothetical protein GALMADRAFT_777902 [Galerina marginata CBS 339.88]
MSTLGDMGQHHPLFPISTGNHILPRELLLEAVELSPSALLARDTFLVNAFSLAALTWLVYDMALNFSKEVTLVWKRWHEPKGRHSRRLYVIVRYFSVLNLACVFCFPLAHGRSLIFSHSWYVGGEYLVPLFFPIPSSESYVRPNGIE